MNQLYSELTIATTKNISLRYTVHAACPGIHATCPCCSSVLHAMLHFHASCPRFMSNCTCCMSTMHVHAACSCCMSMLLVRAECLRRYPCYMSMLLVHAPCLCCMLILPVHAACPLGSSNVDKIFENCFASCCFGMAKDI
jgi:hypothetical protein